MFKQKQIVNRIFFVFILFFLFYGNLFAREEHSPIEEFWQEAYLFRNISDKLRGEILFNNLYSQNLGNYDWFLEGKLSYRANTWLDLELLYRHEFYDFEGVKVQEYRPMFRVSGKKEIGNWTFRNRQRFEYRMFEVESSHFRYRSDLKIKPSWNLTSVNINPYLTEEIFMSHEKINRNRIYFGIEGKKGKIEPALYWLIQSNRYNGNWKHMNILGVMVGFEL